MVAKTRDLPVVTAEMCFSLIQKRHRDDLVVGECKNGPTVSTYGRHLRMDAWVMNRSWSNPLYTAYEIKVNRNDFLRDDKWQRYLEYCNDFYFVCPPGVVDPDELPAEAGLLITSRNGARLFCKKKCARRLDVDISIDLLRYILICRTNADQENGRAPSSVEEWREWLQDKKAKTDLGWKVRGRVSREFHRVQDENAIIRKQNENLEEMKKMCLHLGIDPASSMWRVEQKLRDLAAGIPEILIGRLDRAVNELTRVRDLAQSLRDGNAQS